MPRPAAPAPEEPGPFAFADERRVRGFLDQAGFREVRFEPVDLALDIGVGRGLDAAVETVTGIGSHEPCAGRPATGAARCGGPIHSGGTDAISGR